jgi:hypothetical protein
MAKAVALIIKEDMWEDIEHVSGVHDVPEICQHMSMLLLNMNDRLISWLGQPVTHVAMMYIWLHLRGQHNPSYVKNHCFNVPHIEEIKMCNKEHDLSMKFQ